MTSTDFISLSLGLICSTKSEAHPVLFDHSLAGAGARQRLHFSVQLRRAVS